MILCKVTGCEKEVGRKGYCHMHYKRLRVHGDINYTEKIYSHPEKCTVVGCNRQYSSRGYCKKHYQRFHKYGNPLHTEVSRASEFHGMTAYIEYQTWSGMKARCYYEKHTAYSRYGGRGIKVCQRWKDSFIAFYQDMGPRPSEKHELDREDNDGGYTPDNCRWVLSSVNNQNRNSTKLTKGAVDQMRAEYMAGGVTHLKLAIKYGVTRGHVTAIINNKKWVMEKKSLFNA